jgi:hypothetical protein
MRYLEKTFSSGPNSKAYRDNYTAVFGETVEIEISDENFAFVKELAEEWNLSINDTIVRILREEIEREEAALSKGKEEEEC